MNLYAGLVKDYELRVRTLIAELSDVKQFVNHAYLNVTIVEKKLNGNEQSQLLFTNNEILNQPFEHVYYDLNKYFCNQFNAINKRLSW